MWNRHKTSIIVGVAIICLLAAFWYMPSFAFVFFLSVLLTLLLLDLVDKMALKLPRGLAAFLGLAGSSGAVMSLNFSSSFLVIFLRVSKSPSFLWGVSSASKI